MGCSFYCIVIYKLLKKEIAGDFPRAGEEMLFVDSKLVAMQCCTQAHLKTVYNHLVLEGLYQSTEMLAI